MKKNAEQFTEKREELAEQAQREVNMFKALETLTLQIEDLTQKLVIMEQSVDITKKAVFHLDNYMDWDLERFTTKRPFLKAIFVGAVVAVGGFIALMMWYANS